MVDSNHSVIANHHSTNNSLVRYSSGTTDNRYSSQFANSGSTTNNSGSITDNSHCFDSNNKLVGITFTYADKRPDLISGDRSTSVLAGGPVD